MNFECPGGLTSSTILKLALTRITEYGFHCNHSIHQSPVEASISGNLWPGKYITFDEVKKALECITAKIAKGTSWMD